MTEDEENDDPVDESFHEQFDERFEQRREENLEYAEIEDCELIRKAGNLYQESEFETPQNALEFVSEELSLDREEAKRLLSIYTCIFTELSDEASGHADTAGREYFEGRTIEEIAKNNDRTNDTIRKDIREFVGSYAKDHQVEEIDLIQSLPAHPYEPYKELFDGLSNIPLTNISEFFKGFGLPRIDTSQFVKPSLPRIDTTQFVKPTFDFPVTPIIENFNLGYTDFYEAITPTVSIFEEANLHFEDEFIEAISQEAKSPPDNWDTYSIVDEIRDGEEPLEEPEEREKYEDEGSRAVAKLGNIDRDAARKFYLEFWDASRTTAELMGSHISDGRIAIIACISTILFLSTGNIAAATTFMFIVLDRVSRLSQDEEQSD